MVKKLQRHFTFRERYLENTFKVKEGVLVHSGFYNKVPQTYKTNLFLTVLETGNLKSGCQHDQARSFFLVHSWWLFTMSSHGRRGEGSQQGLFYKNIIPFLKVLPSWTKHLPKVYLLILWQCTWGFQHINWNGGRHKYSDIAVEF